MVFKIIFCIIIVGRRARFVCEAVLTGRKAAENRGARAG